MRADPANFELIAPGSLQSVVTLLANEPGRWLPIAGGTDVMVRFAAGMLPAQKLVSIWNLPELRRMEVMPEEVRIGAGCTYTDLREHPVVAQEFPLLASAARGTGGIANQNRGTLGGNIVNASPAADSLPALLVYEADLILVSVRGERRLPYSEFHLAYKTTRLAPDELIRAICLRRDFLEYVSYWRKVGARNAQAISKVSMAGLARLSGGILEDVRIALGSVAPIPLRLAETEQADPGKGHRAGDYAVGQENRGCGDPSDRRYPIHRQISRFDRGQSGCRISRQTECRKGMNPVLERWNRIPLEEAASEILACCGSKTWALGMAARRPFAEEKSVLLASDETCRSLAEADWREAFHSHPRIGESKAPLAARPQSAAWSVEEQANVGASEERVKTALAEANREYERRFKRIFIVSAAGKSAEEILSALRRRLNNDETTELREAAEQQRQITQIRLRKWMQA